MDDADLGEKCNLTDVPVADVIRSTKCVAACEGLDPTKIGAALDAAEQVITFPDWRDARQTLRDALDAVRKPGVPSELEPEIIREGDVGLPSEANDVYAEHCMPVDAKDVGEHSYPMQVARALLRDFVRTITDVEEEWAALRALRARAAVFVDAGEPSPPSEEREATNVASAAGVLIDALDDAEPKPPMLIGLANSWVEATKYEHVANRNREIDDDHGMMLCEIPGGFAMSTCWYPVIGVASVKELVEANS